MDTLSPEQRHKVMSRIRSKDTVPEKTVRSVLHRAGYRYRICDSRYPGRPDLVLPRYHALIFVHGCFWHGHENCALFRPPKSRQEFWEAKITRNRQRDEQNIRLLQEGCWRICIIWECSLRGKKNSHAVERVADEVIYWLEEEYTPLLEIRGYHAAIRTVQPRGKR